MTELGGMPPSDALDRADLEHSIGARWARIVQVHADREAVCHAGRRLTYRELDGAARAVAAAVSGLGDPGSGCVATLAEHSIAMVVGALGTVVAGKISLGLHPGQPTPALRAILEDARPEYLLATPQQADRAREIASGFGCGILQLDSLGTASGEPMGSRYLDAGKPATLLYTSGSTGKPKGVIRSHRAVLHRIWLSTRFDGIGPGTRQSLLTSSSFASAELDLFGPLMVGGTVCLFDVLSEGLGPFVDWIGAERITHLHPPAMLFRRCLQSLELSTRFPDVRVVAVAGDVVHPSDVALWKRHFSPECVFMHRYSSTETALTAVDRLTAESRVEGAVLPVGCPVPDKTVTVVDDAGSSVPAGVSGNIVVRSRFLASGYWRRPEETTAAFVADPTHPGERVFRTGDRGHFLGDGRLVYEGRRDHQVKIRGYRVELREVEAALESLADVGEAVVLANRDGPDVALHAYVAPRPGGGVSEAEGVEAIRTRLRAVLPEWKVPATVHFLDRLPVTATGKPDRAALSGLVPRQGTLEADRQGKNGNAGSWESLWARALGRADFGSHDDFFRAGGQSLQALQLVRFLEQRLGHRVRLADLMAHPTPAGFAAAWGGRIRSDLETGESKGFRGAAQGTPWIHVPGVYGVEMLPPPLAEVIGRRGPYFDGLEYPGLRGDGELLADIPSLAAEMVRQMEPLGLRQPVVLSGFSFGGRVAIETARLWEASGHRVAAVVLFDTWQRGALRRRSAWRQFCALGRRIHQLPPGTRLDVMGRLVALQWKAGVEAMQKRFGSRRDLRALELEEAARRATLDYHPRIYPGRTDLIHATRLPPDDTGRWERAGDSGWGPFRHPDFHVHPVDCDHARVFREPISPDVVVVVEQLVATFAALR